MNRSRHRNAALEALESRQLLAHVELIRNGAFEGAVSAADWVRSGAWYAASGSHYHGGSQYAYFTDANGNPANNLTGTMYQQVSIPANAVNPTLTFWTKITTSETTTTLAKDVMHVRILDSTGANVLQSLVSLSNLNAVTTSGPHTASGKYTPHTFALSPSLIGQTIRVAFVASTDTSSPTTFRVDDVGLSEPIPVTPGTRGQVVGYLPYYRQSLFGQMDLSKLTWINYFSITASTAGALTTTNVNNTSLATVVNAAHARGIGVSITVGPQSFSTLAASASARQAFATNIKNYIVARNLDGVDIDWEPPGNGVDQVNYGLLIHDLHEQLSPIGKKITAAVNPWTKEIPVAATRLMSWVNVMCYDFHYADHSTYAAAIDGMNQWTHYGVAKDKLVMGVPFYGRSGTSWSNTTSKTYGAIVNEYRAINGVPPPSNMDSFVDASGSTFYFNGITTLQNKMTFVRDNGYAGAMIWELGQDSWESGQYTSQSLLPVVAAIRRPDAVPAPALAAGSDTGVSPTDRITNDNTPTFTGAAPVGMTITVYANGVSIGSTVTGAGGVWSVTPVAALGDGVHAITAVASNANGASPASPGVNVTIDTAAPAVATSGFDFQIEQAVRFEFDEEVGATFALSDLAIANLTTATQIPTEQMTLTRAGDVWRIRFGGAPGGVLADGNYLAQINPIGVSDIAGNALQPAGASLAFFVLAGDANRDRSVNLADFAALAANFNAPGSFAQGDFNYSGVTEIGDFSILASRFNTALPETAAGSAPASSTAAPARPIFQHRRVIEEAGL